MGELNLGYIYYKQAEALKKDLIIAFNNGNYDLCDHFILRYDELKRQVEQNVINKFSSSDNISLPVVLKYSPGFGLPKDRIMFKLIVALNQMISLLQGVSGSFEKEIEALKKELKSVKPLIPNEVVIKVPGKLQKTINEANHSYQGGNWTATGSLLRKMVDNALHLKCKMEKCEDKLRDSKTNKSYDLPKKINICASIGIIRPSRAKELKRIKLYGDSAIHSLHIELTPQDIEDARVPARLLLEELFSKD